jgi:8-oxo-dGTP diphosphatase
MTPIRVVAAIIKSDDNRILIARRKPEKTLGGYWEFPGGKVDVGESDAVALVRELKEELDVVIEVESYYTETIYRYDFGDILLVFYRCKFSDNRQIVKDSTDHDLLYWVSLSELGDYEFAPADGEVIGLLRDHYSDL